MLEIIPALRPPHVAGLIAADPILSSISLPFNPLGLLLFVGWFYLCVYLVQRVNLSPLVPRNYKVYANVLTLLTGPVLPVTLLVIDTVRKTRQTQEGFFTVLRRQIQNVLAVIHSGCPGYP